MTVRTLLLENGVECGHVVLLGTLQTKVSLELGLETFSLNAAGARMETNAQVVYLGQYLWLIAAISTRPHRGVSKGCVRWA